MVEHREGRFCPEDCVNPGDAKCARSNHRADCRVQRMPAAAQNARRYFIQIAQRLKEQDAQNPHACALNDRSIRRKKPRERISEQDNHKNRNRTAKQRQAQTQPQNAPASPMRSPAVNSRLSPTFANPESSSARNGYRLSPRARRAAAPKS